MPRESLTFILLPLTGFMFLALLLCKAISLDRFQSEKETGDRNFAIGYYLKEKKVCSIIVFQAFVQINHSTKQLLASCLCLQCFPPGADMIDALDFYFQVSNTENCI